MPLPMLLFVHHVAERHARRRAAQTRGVHAR
jgi:hypothetical protein